MAISMYTKVRTVFAALDAKIASKASILDFADAFSTEKKYVVDELVVYNNALYSCTSAKEPGDWDDNSFTPSSVGDVLVKMIGKDSIADELDESVAYSVDDLVIIDGVMHRCTVAGTGSDAQFTEANVASVIKELVATIGQLSERVRQIEEILGDSSSDPVETPRNAPAEDSVKSHTRGVVYQVAEDGKNEIYPVSIEDIAPPWSPEMEYKAGTMVSREGKLYCSTAKHRSGTEFDNSMWIRCTIADVIDGIADAFASAIKSHSSAGK